jgi:hypothetical protein
VRGVERQFDVLGVERAISQIRPVPVVGEMLSKYSPLTGATHLPPMKR